jgi:hypothetical protein
MDRSLQAHALLRALIIELTHQEYGRTFVLGASRDDLELMALGNCVVTGALDDFEYPGQVEHLGLSHILVVAECAPGNKPSYPSSLLDVLGGGNTRLAFSDPVCLMKPHGVGTDEFARQIALRVSSDDRAGIDRMG